MSITRNTGQPVLLPESMPFVNDPSAVTSVTLNATTVKAGVTGQVWWPGSGDSKNLQAIEFVTGTISSPVGTIKFSTQGVSLTAGGGIPDGSEAKNSTTTTMPSASSAFKSPNFSSTQSVTRGQLLACLVEFSAYTSGSLNIAGTTADTYPYNGQGSFMGYSGGAWGAPQAAIPRVKLYFDDGTIGTLLGSWHGTAALEAFNNGSTPPSRGNRYIFGVPYEIEGFELSVDITGYTRDFKVVLYKGTTKQESFTVDADTLYSGSIRHLRRNFTTRHTAAASETWYLMIEPATSSNNNIGVVTVPASGDLALLPGGTEVQYTSFNVQDGGGTPTPTVTDTKRVLLGLLVSGFDAGGGGAQYSGVTMGMVVG